MEILSYHNRPDIQFFGSKRGFPYIGTELEVATLNLDTDLEICERNISDFAYLNQDGSIHKTGFEIISQPMTLTEHQKRWTKFFDSISDSEFMSHGANCGMHVHLSRPEIDSWNERETFYRKLNRLLNCESLNSLVVKMAGRESSFCRREDMGEDWQNYDASTDKRYKRLNLANGDTVEVRIFDTTTNPVKFLGNVEFCHALYSICLAPKSGKEDEKQVIKFIVKNKNKYPNLNLILKQLRLIY